jgi:hypothetical protein
MNKEIKKVVELLEKHGVTQTIFSAFNTRLQEYFGGSEEEKKIAELVVDQIKAATILLFNPQLARFLLAAKEQIPKSEIVSEDSYLN